MGSFKDGGSAASGGGEMDALVRAIDWSSSPLGPPAEWPQSLRTAVSLCLSSRFPMAVAWGPSYALVYNDAYVPMLGRKHPWAFGRACFEVWGELADVVRPMFDNVIATGEATWADDLALTMLRHGYLEEVHFTVSYSAIRGESGAPDGVLVTAEETTARVLSERRLRLVRDLGNAAGLARSLADVAGLSSPLFARHHADVPFSVLYAIDESGRIAYLQAATGVEPGSAAAPHSIVLADAADTWPIARVVESGERLVAGDLRGFGELPGGLFPDRPSHAVLLPIPRPGTGDTKAVLIAGVNPRRALDEAHLEFFDLVALQIANAMANALAHEEARQRAEALAAVDRAKTTFFSNISHEFRTPLTLMLGPLQDVASAQNLTPEQREGLELARRNSLRLLKLVNSLLDFSRIEAGRLDASFEATDLATFTSELASVFRSAAERAGLRFVVDCQPAIDAVFVDRDLWEKVVLNLLSNAFKHTFEGEIAVLLSQVGSHVELTVRDTGTGIPADELPHIFERFRQARGVRSRSFEGTGIGLALVHELVRLHGGTVRVDTAVNRGTAFIVSIPVGSAHLPAHSISAPRGLDSTRIAGDQFVAELLRWLPTDVVEARHGDAQPESRILVVDDNLDMRDYLRRLLSLRYDVAVASDGVEALASIRQRPPDVVLTDVMMPRLDGFGLLAALRADAATSEIPVVMLSARAGEDARVEGLRAGADDYLVKPFSANELLARVASTVQLARLRRAGEERLALANRELRRHLLEQETLLDVLPIGIGIATDRECREIRINRAFAATLGLRSDANASKTAPASERPTNFRVFTPQGKEVRDRDLPMQLAAREGVEARGVELDIVHDDGRIVRLLEYAAPVLDEQGLPRGAVGAFVDVSASHQAQRGLARSEERFRRIFDTAGVSLWEEDLSAVKTALDTLKREGVTNVAAYFTAHPEFVDRCFGLKRILAVNSAGLRMFGARDKETLFASIDAIYPPGNRTVFVDELLALARGDRRFEAEIALRRLDGRAIYALMRTTFPGPGEPFDSVLVSLADITDRKLSETALHQEVATRATLAHVGASLAGELNTDRLVQAVTDAATTLTTAQFGAFFYNATNDRGEAYSLYALSGVPAHAFGDSAHPHTTEIFGPTFRGETIIRLDDVTKDARYGKSGPFFGLPDQHPPLRSYLAVPVIGRGGRVLGGLFFGHAAAGVFTVQHEQLATGVASWAAIALDNARLYRDVEQANRLKDEFLATLSHELRTPLNAVLGWAHMLREGSVKPPMQQRALESIERNARAQAQLVEDLLDVSRIMSGKLQVKTDAVDLGAVVTNAVDTVRAGAAAKRLTLEVNVDTAQEVLVTGDADRLQQIVWNLVSNAIKFTPSGGRVEVSLRRDDRWAEIVVEDNGEGIAASFRPHLFERFRQMDASTARRQGGLGLGLSIVRHLTEAHGGTVTAESAGPGLGSSFRVQLPLHAVSYRPSLAAPPGAAASTALANVRALVVDDEHDARELMRYVLASRGAHVMTATSAGEALHLVDQHDFDVIIADIGMPEQDGYALIRVLRDARSPRERALSAIAVTSYSGVRERDQALAAGYDWHLAKPVDPEQLIATVTTAVDVDATRARRDASAQTRLAGRGPEQEHP